MTEESTWRLDMVFEEKGSPIYQLSPGGSDKTLLMRFAAKAKNRHAAVMLLSTLNKICSISIGRSIEIGIIKRLQDEIVEVRVSGSVVRALSYQKAGENVLVLLDVIRGHQGSGNISKEISEAKKKAIIVRALIDEMEGKE